MNNSETQQEYYQRLGLLYLSALLHHIPNKAMSAAFSTILGSHPGFSYVLEIADRYAFTQAGMLSPGFFQTVASPFENIGDENRTDLVNAFPQTKLSLSKSSFPAPKSEIDNNVEGLWEDFASGFENNNFENSEEAVENSKAVLNSLSQFATAIPNPGNVNPSVSWYDYAKMKAGLAVCIAEYTGWKNRAIGDEEEPLIIIRADISGIQRFIYDIASKQASKNLKGRSFYVQLLSDAVLRRMLKSFDLFEGNVMYSSGGNFFVLAPNTEKTIKRFDQLEKEVTRALFKSHDTRLSVVMGYEKVRQSEILNGKINESISRLFKERIDRKKKQKFLSVINSDEGYRDLFEPDDLGGNLVTDAVTGERVDLRTAYTIAEGALPKLLMDKKELLDNENTGVISEATAKQIFLGYQLKDIAYVIVADQALNVDDRLNRENRFEPGQLGIYYYAVKKGSESDFEKALSPQSILDIWIINESYMQKWHSIPVRQFLYGGNSVPVLNKEEANAIKEDNLSEVKDREEGSPKYFDEMSGKGRFKRLGVLRMDVDNLGQLFKNASTDQLTFSYYAALSRNLDWFFRGYINTIWGSNEEFKSHTQIIYSGGDDLFVIGRWDLMIAFAEQIKEDFSAFTCQTGGSPSLSLSGGIAIVTHKFPIMKAAAFSEDAEKAAKGHKLEVNGEYAFSKNSIALFGMPLHWDTEYQLVKELKEELVLYVESERNPKGLPKSILGKIQTYSEMARKYRMDYNRLAVLEPEKRGAPPIPSWVWHVVYDFSRMIDRVKGADRLFARKMRDKIDENLKLYLKSKTEVAIKVKNAIFTNTWENTSIQSSYHFVELLSVAAKWAELEIRNYQPAKTA